MFGPLADFVRGFGECQPRVITPGECGWLPDRRELEICHGRSRGSGHGDWIRDDGSGEIIGNVFLGCPRCHDWCDSHKLDSQAWMFLTGRENGRLAIEFGVEPVL